MADHTHIQWTEATWNPVAGCRKVSAGCDHCYAIRDAHRLAGNANPKVEATYIGLTTMQNGRLNWTGVFRELPERLDQPLRWTRPRRIFVNSMSDLFGEGIREDFIYRVFAVMGSARQHQFQVLTKRPERAQRLLAAADALFHVQCEAEEHCAERGWCHMGEDSFQWPLPNVWLGTSVEDQKAADQRIPALLETPAAVRFLSCEPLLGPLSLDLGRRWNDLHWMIVGGESGPGARSLEEEWLVDIALDCVDAGVPLFVKQFGSVWARAHGATHPKGGDPAEWPAELRIRAFPEVRA